MPAVKNNEEIEAHSEYNRAIRKLNDEHKHCKHRGVKYYVLAPLQCLLLTSIVELTNTRYNETAKEPIDAFYFSVQYKTSLKDDLVVTPFKLKYPLFNIVVY
jgi:hypothetical protein